ncbi:MAG: DUF4386 domain-containing protein [Hyphomicrobiaceae bacterium]|nr:DUF4386 domain-containing protein [Hyphomicrobiaceae bacterium]
MRNKNKKTALLVGVLILTAYGLVGSNNPDAKITGMILETISGFSVIFIAILIYPYFKPYGRKLSLSYLVLKGIEGVLMVIAGILFMIHSPDLLHMRDSIYLIHGYIFAVPALIFYYLLFKSKLVPQWLSLWGIGASIILVIVNLLEAAGMIPMIEVLYLPIVLNEVVLAIWLMIKGFNLPSIKKK